MADLVSELASRVGISPDLARKGLGTVLAFVKDKIPADAYAKIASAVPGGNQLAADALADQPPAEGGIMNAVSGLVGKVFGGGSGAALMGKLSEQGFSPEQIPKFLGNAFETLKEKLPADITKHLTDHIPVPEEATA